MSGIWTAPPLWQGETAFIVCGGTSVLSQNLDLIRGRRVVAVNSSGHIVPWADVLFFNDSRWWRIAENRNLVDSFRGMVVTTAPSAWSANIRKMNKVKPPGLTDDRGSLSVQNTSTTGATNLVKHFGVARIVFLGLDGKPGKGGRTHHHDPHCWPQRDDCWPRQRAELETIRKPLAKAGIEVVNCSPGSVYGDLWPVMTLTEYLCQLDSSSSATKPPIERNSFAMA